MRGVWGLLLSLQLAAFGFGFGFGFAWAGSVLLYTFSSITIIRSALHPDHNYYVYMSLYWPSTSGKV